MTTSSLLKKSAMCFGISGVFFSACVATAAPTVLQSDTLMVTIDNSFPRVIDYTWKANRAKLHGQSLKLSEVKINGKSYTPKVTFQKVDAKRGRYQLDFSSIKVSMTVEFSVEKNVLSMKIIKIDDSKSIQVKRIEFPHHGLVSVDSGQKGAALASCHITGMWQKISEEFISLKQKKSEVAPAKTSYVIVNTSQLAASISNNIIEYERMREQTVQLGKNKKSSIWNGVWDYRGPDAQVLSLPWSKVVIVADENNDGHVDWQDGAIAYRKITKEPEGAENIRNCISYISFNAGSVANAPFLRALEDAKQLSLMLDGFGQMVQLKGYQSEGHDAAHPDCAGNYNKRAGGLKDLKTILKYGAKYNIAWGVHINVSESYPEAKNFNDAILKVPHKKGWVWYDQSLEMDYRKDALSGNLYKRLDLMKHDLPELKWVYVDVYGGRYGNDAWAAYKLASKLNQNGCLVGSEYFGPMEAQSLWTHLQLSPQGTTLLRFIKNNSADIFRPLPLLKGSQRFGIGGWEENYNFHKVVEVFFRQNLPTKYMQHFPILKMTKQRVDFEGGVYVENQKGWKLFRNGKLLADEKNRFIPWSPEKENKIYYWTELAMPLTWELPASWVGKKTAYLYQLTRLGRKLVKTLPVQNGKVTIQANSKTPYVIYPQAAEKQNMVWGEGGRILNPGFSSESLSGWEKQPSNADPKNINVVVDQNANAVLTIKSLDGLLGKNEPVGVCQPIRDLLTGKTYSASVWVRVTGKGKAWIGVRMPNGKMVKNWVGETHSVRSEGRLKFKGTTFQRLSVVFTAPKHASHVQLVLWVDSGMPKSKVEFDDVRIVSLPGKTSQKGHVLFEDFENVDEQWGPFVAANGTDNTHLSECNPGKTHDTIHGRYSLKNFNEGKVGDIYRTVQATLKFKPNTSYTVRFQYINKQPNAYIALKSQKGGNADTQLKNIPLGKGSFETTFKTGNRNDYYIVFGRTLKSKALLVIDDFTVDKKE